MKLRVGFPGLRSFAGEIHSCQMVTIKAGSTRLIDCSSRKFESPVKGLFTMRISFLLPFSILFVSCSITFAQLDSGWKAHDLSRPAPAVVTPAETSGGPPSDAIVLFDGTDMSNWTGKNGKAIWKIVDGAMESVPKSGYVISKEKFGDCQVHIEFASPKNVNGNGQGRGNSGVFLMGEFEVQALDSFENPT